MVFENRIKWQFELKIIETKMRIFLVIFVVVVQAMNYGKTEEKMCLDGVKYVFTESFGSGSSEFYKL